MSTTMYGFIACDTSVRCYEECVNVIESLPLSGQFVVKNSFHVIPHSRGHAYHMNMITFGMDQKEDYCFDMEFLRQFEHLLARLNWQHAELIHTWTGSRMIWNRHRLKDNLYSSSTEFTRRAYGSMHDLPIVDV